MEATSPTSEAAATTTESTNVVAPTVLETSSSPVSPVTESVLASLTEQDPSVKNEMDKELQELYKVVSAKIRLSVANQKLTPESFQTILLKVVDTVEEFSSGNIQKLTGTEKRAIEYFQKKILQQCQLLLVK